MMIKFMKKLRIVKIFTPNINNTLEYIFSIYAEKYICDISQPKTHFQRNVINLLQQFCTLLRDTYISCLNSFLYRDGNQFQSIIVKKGRLAVKKEISHNKNGCERELLLQVKNFLPSLFFIINGNKNLFCWLQ